MKAWCAKDPGGELWLSTLTGTRRWSIERCINLDSSWPEGTDTRVQLWRKLRRQGWKVVQVRIEEVDGE